MTFTTKKLLDTQTTSLGLKDTFKLKVLIFNKMNGRIYCDFDHTWALASKTLELTPLKVVGGKSIVPFISIPPSLFKQISELVLFSFPVNSFFLIIGWSVAARSLPEGV